MKFFFFITTLCFLVSCGSHTQNLMRTETQEPPKYIVEDDPTQVLINAVERGDLVALETLADSDQDLNIRNPEGLTLIMLAIKNEHFAVIEFLVDQEVNLELVTVSEEIDPSLNAREFLDSRETMGLKSKEVIRRILNREAFDVEILKTDFFESIKSKEVSLFNWLLEKGVDPNTIQESPKTTPLILLLSLRGVEGEELVKLKAMFDILVSHPDIDVNLSLDKRKNPLRKAKRQLKKNPEYQSMVDKLIEMGATE